MPSGSLVFVVAWELSNFFANWCMLLAGNCLNSTCPSFKFLETKDSSFRKKNKIYLAGESGQFLEGTWLRQLVSVWHCTTHPHFYYLAKSLSSKSNLALHLHWLGACKTLQTSAIWLLGSTLHWKSSKKCIGLNHNHHSRPQPSVHFLASGSISKLTF